MRRLVVPLIVAAAFVGVTVVVILLQGGGDSVQLASAEVTEYQGQRLESINAFRENSIAGPQQVDRDSYRLEVTGLVASPGSYGYDELLNGFAHFKKVVTLNCVEGWSAKVLWEGVRVQDIIDAARPLPEARVVIFHAADGYTTQLPIEYFQEKDILMAFKINDVTLPAERGFPFQLVAESKWGYKWIKWITGIEFSDDISYRGYWEDRGYSDSGDLDRPFLD